VGGTCGTHGREECIHGLDGKARRKETTWKTKVQVGDEIRMDVREIGRGSLEWIELAEDRDR
jgi:hypothetical protein